MKKSIKDRLQYIIIYLLVIGMIFIIVMTFMYSIPSLNKDVSLILLGVFSTKFADAIAYLLNSSKGSAEKSEIIAKLPALPTTE